jgi:hypothetical protein
MEESPMQFYVRADGQTQPIGPFSLSAAVSIVRATALAQRAKGSRVWAGAEGKLFVKESGCALEALWVTDACDRIISIVAISEFGTLGQQISHGLKGHLQLLMKSRRH